MDTELEYTKRYNLCRHLHGGADKPPSRAEESFILSRLYRFDLNSTAPALVFRAGRIGESAPTADYSKLDTFEFIQTLMRDVSDCVNHRNGRLHSYSKSLTIPLFKYTRATELSINIVELNSVVCEDGQSIPFKALTSLEFSSAFREVSIDISNCDLADLDRYYSDWDMPRFKRNASYKTDHEILTNKPADEKFTDIAELCQLYLEAIHGKSLEQYRLKYPLICGYLELSKNLAFEKSVYIKLEH